MPYIDQDRREEIASGFGIADSPGELNFFITSYILNHYLPENAGYTAMNEVIGVLEAVKLEFYRRLVSPYEDTKIELNGDVYE